MLDKVHKMLDEYLIDLAHSDESFSVRIDPLFPCSLMFISMICSYLLYQWRPDCHFLWFVALQTRLSVTGEMSLLYIKQFVCLGKSIFYRLSFDSFTHFHVLSLLRLRCTTFILTWVLVAHNQLLLPHKNQIIHYCIF